MKTKNLVLGIVGILISVNAYAGKAEVKSLAECKELADKAAEKMTMPVGSDMCNDVDFQVWAQNVRFDETADKCTFTLTAGKGETQEECGKLSFGNSVEYAIEHSHDVVGVAIGTFVARERFRHACKSVGATRTDFIRDSLNGDYVACEIDGETK